MSGGDAAYALSVVRPAARALAQTLPEGVAAAVVEFINGDLLREPRRVGKPLRDDLEGRYVARRGDYRIIDEIDDGDGLVRVLLIEHRRDAYRRR